MSNNVNWIKNLTLADAGMLILFNSLEIRLNHINSNYFFVQTQ